jgi:predicted Zn-dependent protease
MSLRSFAVSVWAVVVVAMLFAACNRVPYTNRRNVILIDWSSELKLGADAYKEIVGKEKTVTRGKNARIMARVGEQLRRTTPANFRSLDWEFRLLNSDAVNAFALPGGKVAVYEGIVPILHNEGGMAAVVGHEIGHAVGRHGAERISGTMLLQLGLSIADVGLSNSEMHDQLLSLLGLGATVGAVLPFSRANELESDYLGGIFMARAGYDPKESAQVWRRMTKTYGDNPMEFLSTHPSNAKRIARLEEEMPTFRKHYKRARTKRGVGSVLEQ